MYLNPIEILEIEYLTNLHQIWILEIKPKHNVCKSNRNLRNWIETQHAE